jgi:putative spermidine/putrescine transport system permease protein
MAWLIVIYLASLVAMLATSFFATKGFPKQMVWSGEQYERLTEPVYRRIALRTLRVAISVTLLDLVIALPMAFVLAKVASRRVRRAMLVGLTMPLWAGYLVKAYAWRTILDPSGGVLKRTFGWSPGFGYTGVVVALAYLWLPYMIMPIYAGLERLPNSFLEASADLGASSWFTLRAVVLPQLIPSIVAGSIFTFSLSLGDYIVVQIVGGKLQMIGNVISREFGTTSIPFAAAFTVVPVVIMVVYLIGAKRTGAFDNL